eukprot:TRINITY_DN10488_c1_g1_i1.p1 TRINITY_DN10488_c1_g1~~TRINITY_DN10488_c1_g1_i1.p1  ORF type:complete len:129 (+),score=15.03 TRINITY_DN10488_c1_g1_i1:52-387(+)
MSFVLLEIFLNVLADQLRSLSRNEFFRVPNVKAMLRMKKAENLRSNLVHCLLMVSTRFALRSVKSVRSFQNDTVSKKEISYTRLNNIESWSSSNPFVLFFNSYDGSGKSSF